MADDFIPQLRGNIFFLFLLRAARSDLGVAPSWGRSSQGLTQAQMFANLMRTVCPTYSVTNEDSLRQYLSKYMKGERTHSSTYYPFKDAAFQSGATMHMESDYGDALGEMDRLCRTFLDYENEGARKLLVGGLAGLILKDDTIPASSTFNTGYRDVTKAELANEERYILQPFLLSVWYYIVTSKPNAEEGAETYSRWTADAGGGNPRAITTRWGEKMGKKIAVSVELPGEAEPDTAEEEHEVLEGEAVVVDQEDRKQQTLINHNGRIYNQRAEKIVNIEHVETLYI